MVKLGIKKNFATEKWMHSLLSASMKQFRMACALSAAFTFSEIKFLSVVTRWKSINALCLVTGQNDDNMNWSWITCFGREKWCPVDLLMSLDESGFRLLCSLCVISHVLLHLANLLSDFFFYVCLKVSQYQKKCRVMKINMKLLRCFSAPLFSI